MSTGGPPQPKSRDPIQWRRKQADDVGKDKKKQMAHQGEDVLDLKALAKYLPINPLRTFGEHHARIREARRDFERAEGLDVAAQGFKSKELTIKR